MIRGIGRISFFPFFSFNVHGRPNLPKKTAFVLLVKHQRWEDIPLLGLATPRPLYYIAKAELFHGHLSNWLLRSLGGIPLNRQRPMESRHSFHTLLHLLKAGEGAVVFPEGTYFKDKMGPGHVGVVRLILSRLSLPFIPVGIKYSHCRVRTMVRIAFGRPFYAESGIPVREFLNTAMNEIASLSGLPPYHRSL